MDNLLKTSLHSIHAQLGAKLVPFAGYEMPVSYTGINLEHNAVREAAGLFDVSHMGHFRIEGPDATAYLEHLTTNKVSNLVIGQVQYSLLLNEQGNLIDDILVYKLDQNRYQMIVNASNNDADWQWCIQQSENFDVELESRSGLWGILALQGPKSVDILKAIALPGEDLKYYHCLETVIDETQISISRTGYTGEDGFEIYAPSDMLELLWQNIMEKGEEFGISPAGLGCRDTLRLEAGYSLYGHELNIETNPLDAGLAWVVSFEKEFIGSKALLTYKNSGIQKKCIGLEILDKAIPREGFEVQFNGNVIGKITSGTMSPTLKKPIAMAIVQAEGIQIGTEVEVIVRGAAKKAIVVNRRFYKRA
jgi:aminomethyltransferase